MDANGHSQTLSYPFSREYNFDQKYLIEASKKTLSWTNCLEIQFRFFFSFAAFMGMTSKTTDLRLLKKLVFNSIKYSSLSDSRKSKCLSLVKRKWFEYMKKFRP